MMPGATICQRLPLKSASNRISAARSRGVLNSALLVPQRPSTSTTLNGPGGCLWPLAPARTLFVGPKPSSSFLASFGYNRTLEEEVGGTTTKEKKVLPSTYNFAEDVIDKLAEDKDSAGKTAFYYVSKRDHQPVLRWSFQELSRQSKLYGSALRSTLGKQRVAMVLMPKVPEWWALNVAALRIGMALSPGTTMLTSPDIDIRIKMSGTKCIFCDPASALKVEEGSMVGQLEHKVLVASKYDDVAESTSGSAEKDSAARTLVDELGWIPLDEVVQQLGVADCPLEKPTPVDEISYVFFTSGTTGDPKMVAQPHSYLCGLGIAGKHWMALTGDDLHWNLSDNGWAKMVWSGLYGPWSQGAGVFIHGADRFVDDAVFRMLKDHPVTSICASPTTYRSLILNPKMAQLDRRRTAATGNTNTSSSPLRQCLSAGEPLNDQVIKVWHEKTGIWIREGYGMTETTLVAGTFEGMEVRPGSMGKEGPGYRVCIVNNMGNEVEHGQQGNIAVDCSRGKPVGMFLEYLDDPQSSKKCMLGNYFITGDRGHKDKDGYIWFDSRTDDLIISSGYRIGPFEVESALISHPAVAESAVVPSPDPQRGTVVKAFVVLKDEVAKTLEKKPVSVTEKLINELQEHCRLVTAPYKYPRKIEFVPKLPKTVSGKILRYKLKNQEMGR